MSEGGGPVTALEPPAPSRPPSDTPQSRRRLAGIAIAAAGACLVLLLTLWPMPSEAKRAQLTPVWCLVCGAVGMQDVLQNVMMLIPLGFGLGLAGWSARRATFAGFALALAVELLQYTVVPGRDASLSDVATNTLGTAFGALLAARYDLLLHPPARVGARLALGGLGAWACLWLLAGWLLRSSPGPAPWRAELQPELINAPPFEGRIAAAELGGTALHAGLQELPPRVREAYARDSVSFTAEVVTAAPSTRRTGVLVVWDGDSLAQLIVLEQGGALHLAMRTRSSLLLLRPITFRMPPAAPVPAGARLDFSLRREAGALVILPRRSGELPMRAPIGPHWLATILLPVEAWPGPGWEAFAYLWVAAMLLCVGWWTAHAHDASRLTLAFLAFAVVIFCLRSVPQLFGLSPTSAIGWAMGCGAPAAGLLLGRLRGPDLTSPANTP